MRVSNCVCFKMKCLSWMDELDNTDLIDSNDSRSHVILYYHTSGSGGRRSDACAGCAIRPCSCRLAADDTRACFIVL